MRIIKEKWDNPSIDWIEDEVQAAIVTALSRIEKQLKSFSFAADMNAGKRSKGDGARKKALGMRAGESDLRVYLPHGKLWMPELKMNHNGVVSAAQRERHGHLQRLGHDVEVLWCETPWHGVEQIIDGLSKRLGCEKDKLWACADVGSRRGGINA